MRHAIVPYAELSSQALLLFLGMAVTVFALVKPPSFSDLGISLHLFNSFCLLKYL